MYDLPSPNCPKLSGTQGSSSPERSTNLVPEESAGCRISSSGSESVRAARFPVMVSTMRSCPSPTDTSIRREVRS